MSLSDEELKRLVNQAIDKDFFSTIPAHFSTIYKDAYKKAVNDEAQIKVSYSEYDSNADRLNKIIKRVNESQSAIAEKIAPKLHEFIRQKGKPSYYPTELFSHLTISISNYDGSLPFKEKNVDFPFHYCATQFKELNSSGSNLHYNEFGLSHADFDTIQFKGIPQIMNYKPEWREDYDSTLVKMNKLIEERKAKAEQAQKEVDELKEKYSDSKNIIISLIKMAGKLILSVLYGELVSTIPMVIAFILPKIIDIKAFDFQKICIYAALVISIGIIIWTCIAMKFWSPIKDFFNRKKTKKELDNKEDLISNIKYTINEFKNSEDYKKALERNQKAYEADCKLAEEWQTEWYREYIRKHS